MSKQIIKLDVREQDLVRTLGTLFYNDYDYVIVKPTDQTMQLYEVEAHIGKQNESSSSN